MNDQEIVDALKSWFADDCPGADVSPETAHDTQRGDFFIEGSVDLLALVKFVREKADG